jgi:transcriptional regulator of acetoin/glycerol metabolism
VPWCGRRTEELLRRLAEEAGERIRTVRRRLSSGVTASIQVLPVRQPKGEFAAVLVLEPVETPADAGGPACTGDDRAVDFRGHLSRALREGRPVLLAGERGCGKRHEARAALRAVAGPDQVVELDGTSARLAPDDWLHGFESALRAPGTAVLVGHVSEIPQELATTVANLVDGARGPIVATTAEDRGPVAESFPIVLTVPPLRERREEFAELCANLLAEPGEEPRSLTPRAAATLMAADWPGNLRQLLQVLASARIRAAGSTIDLPDLPAHHHRSPQGDPMDEVQRAERRVLIAALREAGGDCNTVAKRLGISRATVYRKLRRYELR